MSVLNTPALSLAGVERFITGGEGLWGRPVVHLDDAGQPTGVVAEIDGLLPIPESSAEELTRLI